MILENEFESLLTADQIPSKIRKTRLEYEEISIKNNQEQEYVRNGWVPVEKKRYKTSLRIRRFKGQDELFRDRIWTLFASMNFHYMSNDNGCNIEYEKDSEKKKVDVLAADNQVVLILECKTSEKTKKSNFQKDIAEISEIREKVIKRIKQHSQGKPKIAWIFCSENILLSSRDSALFNTHNIIYLNVSDIQYYEELVKRIGASAKYQLFGRFFSQQTIPELKSIVPAVKGSMGSYIYYSFSIEPETLLQISYIMHRTQTSEESLHTYQRMVSSKRIKEIGNFIDLGGFFPNAVIINIDTKNGKALRFDLYAPKSNYHSQSQLGLLYLPKVYRSAYVIDGQHRLYGYACSRFAETNTIPVVAFENLPSEVQTNLFVEINSKQKSVNRNLLSTLDAELRWDSPQKDDAIKALKSKLAQVLTEKTDSPLYDRIITGEIPKTETRCITLAYFCDYGLNKCKFFGFLQGKRLVKPGYLCDHYDFANLTLDKAYLFFKKCFELVESSIPNQWELGDANGGFIGKNIGVSAFVVIINDILEFIEHEKGVICSELSAELLFQSVKQYLDTILAKLKNLPSIDLDKMSKQYGSGGVEKVRREFQRWLNKEFPAFNPLGLEQYIKDSSGKYNEETRSTVLTIQRGIKNFIFEKLRNEYGEKWWIDGIPRKIQHECSIKCIDGGRVEDEWNYLELMHYQEIVRTQWTLLGNFFTSPETEQASKDKKISWFVKLNSIRNKVMHPERDSVKEDEYNFVMNTSDWLNGRMYSYKG